MQIQSVWIVFLSTARLQKINSPKMESRQRHNSQLAVLCRTTPLNPLRYLANSYRQIEHHASSQSILETVLFSSSLALRHECAAFPSVSTCVGQIYRPLSSQLAEELNWNTLYPRPLLESGSDTLHQTHLVSCHLRQYGRSKPISTTSMSTSKTAAQPRHSLQIFAISSQYVLWPDVHLTALDILPCEYLTRVNAKYHHYISGRSFHTSGCYADCYLKTLCSRFEKLFHYRGRRSRHPMYHNG